MTPETLTASEVERTLPGPLQQLQEGLVVCSDQIRELFSQLPQKVQGPLQEQFGILMQVLQQTENVTVVLAFRTGQLDFREEAVH